MAKKLDLKEKTPSELTQLLAEKREALRQVRFSMQGARVKDSNEPKKLRADIARLLTERGARSI